jgi:broad specificity phosphatase PhoE
MILDSDSTPLTPEGEAQVAGLVDFFRARPLPVVFASPLRRARQTAEIIAGPLGLDVVEIDGFRELVPAKSRTRFRRGRQRSVRYWFLRSMFRQFLPFSRVAESAWRARRRVRTAWEELLAWRPDESGGTGGNAEPDAGARLTERLVCAHRGTLLLLRSVLRRSGEWRIVRLSVENAGITEIVRRRR